MTKTIKELKNLKKAIDASYEHLEPFREASYETIQQYVGAHYGKNKDEKNKLVPVNFIQLAADIYVQHIAPVCPRYHARPKKAGLDQAAGSLELGLNHLTKEIKLGAVYQEAVMNSIFSMGIVKVGTAGVDRGTVIDATQPYAECVSMNDWVHDVTAKRFDQVAFCGHKVFLDYEVFKKCGLYKNTDKVQAYKPIGDEDNTNIAEFSGDLQRRDEFKEVVEMWEIYLPFENRVINIPCQGTPHLLRDIEWSGSETGPYHLLRFNDVPDNIMPAPPVSAWQDLHTLANDLMIKIKNQASRQKTILAVGSNMKDEGLRVANSSDGQVVHVSDPQSMKEIRFGGAEPTNQATFAQVRDVFSWVGGNIDQLGGLSAQADTFGQEQLIGMNASKRVIKMKQRYQAFAQSVGEGLADEMWYDPNIDLPLVKEYPNSGIQIRKRFNPDVREGDFLDYNIDIDPYSLEYQTPGEKLQSLMQIFGQFIMPMIPVMQQQGGQVNAVEMVNLLAHYSNTPELKNLVVFNDQPISDSQEIIQPGEGDTSTYDSINSTNRANKRVPTGGTRSFKDQQFALAAMNYNTQPKEQQAATRMQAY